MSVSADGTTLANWSGSAGTGNVQPIPNRGPTPCYRVKFGVYKKHESSATPFTTHFDNLLVTQI